MMRPEDILFSVNEYDRDGDVTDTGVFLHFGETRVKAAETIEQFSTIVPHLRNMLDEIAANYPNGN